MSGYRSELRRSRPVSIRRSPSSIRQRVTSQETTPRTTSAAGAMKWPGDVPLFVPLETKVGTTRSRSRSATGPARTTRRERVQAVPAVRRRRAHSPAARDSPRAASWSRSRAATSRLEPRDPRVARRRRGVHAHRRKPERALDRPGRHVDELHAPVRHDREPPDEQRRAARAGRPPARGSPRRRPGAGAAGRAPGRRGAPQPHRRPLRAHPPSAPRRTAIATAAAHGRDQRLDMPDVAQPRGGTIPGSRLHASSIQAPPDRPTGIRRIGYSAPALRETGLEPAGATL